jgi:MFS family permease
MIPSHGLCYACFFAVAYIYVDAHSSPQNRAGAQQLFTILIAGVGYLAGNLFAGKAAQRLTLAGTAEINFSLFWVLSASLALLVAAALALFFREERPLQTSDIKPHSAPSLR